MSSLSNNTKMTLNTPSPVNNDKEFVTAVAVGDAADKDNNNNNGCRRGAPVAAHTNGGHCHFNQYYPNVAISAVKMEEVEEGAVNINEELSQYNGRGQMLQQHSRGGSINHGGYGNGGYREEHGLHRGTRDGRHHHHHPYRTANYSNLPMRRPPSHHHHYLSHHYGPGQHRPHHSQAANPYHSTYGRAYFNSYHLHPVGRGTGMTGTAGCGRGVDGVGFQRHAHVPHSTPFGMDVGVSQGAGAGWRFHQDRNACITDTHSHLHFGQPNQQQAHTLAPIWRSIEDQNVSEKRMQSRDEPSPNQDQPTQFQLQLPSNASSALFQDLPDSVKTMPGGWILQEDCCRAVSNGAEVGFSDAYKPSETFALLGVGGILRTKLTIHSSEHKRFTTGQVKEKKTNCKVDLPSSPDMIVEREILCDYKCDARLCSCRMRIARVNCNGVCGILGYQQIDPATGTPYEHNLTGHSLFPYEEQGLDLREAVSGTKSKFSSCALSVAQKEYIVKYGSGTSKRGVQKDIATSMASDTTDVRCSNAQIQRPSDFLKKVKEYIDNRKRAGDHYFTNEFCQSVMSGEHLHQILDILKNPDEFRAGDNPDNPHLLTPDFKDTLLQNLVVHGHDHDGSTWRHITFEFNDWKDVVTEAVKMYPEDGLLQLEMDFFKGSCQSDEWQTGQIGFSDLDHKYHLLAMDISKSENNVSAGRLLQRALDMLNECDGDCNYVLVDGGSALNKAIDNANNQRMSVRIIRKRACHAHINRRPNTRGGGKRGGKGSLPRYLLDQGVSSKTMGKIVACVFMISWIPPTDEASYKQAISLLIDKFDEHLNDHVKDKYLNGNRLDLGGHMCGRPGEVASTQGMEKTGGTLKGNLQHELSKLNNPNQESTNPYHLMVAAATYKKFNGNQVTTQPNKLRKEIQYAYFGLKEFCAYIPPSSQRINSTAKRCNFPSEFIYSFICVENGDGLKTYNVPLHEAIGGKYDAFTWIVPTNSCIFTALSQMLLDDVNSTSGVSLNLQQSRLQSNTGRDELTDVSKLATILTALSPQQQKALKQRILNKLVLDTSQQQPDEDVWDFLYRRAQRPPTDDALDTSHREEVGSKQKGRRKQSGGGKSKKSQGGQSKMTLKEKREEELRKDKEGDNASDNFVVDVGNNDDELIDVDELIQEQPAPQRRIRVKKELGDFTRTKVGPQSENISCTCGHFSTHRWCEQCVYIDVLHFQNFPSNSEVTSAADQWHVIREKFLAVLKEVYVKS